MPPYLVFSRHATKSSLERTHVILQQKWCIDYYQVRLYVSLVLSAGMRPLNFARASANICPSGFHITSMIVGITLSTTAWYSARRTNQSTGQHLLKGPEMTTLKDRPNTALLVIDMQNDVVKDTYRRDTVIENINTLVARARAEKVPVIWIQHSNDNMPEGSEGWQYVSELQRLDSEPLVPKRYGDAFEDTDLETVLAGLGVGHLIVMGAETDACIHSTIYGAFARGYDVTLVSDAHTAQDKTQWGAPPVPQVIDYMNLCWSFQTAPGRTARATKTGEVTFGA